MLVYVFVVLVTKTIQYNELQEEHLESDIIIGLCHDKGG